MSSSRGRLALLWLLFATPVAAQTCIDYTECGAAIIGQPDSQYRAEELVTVGTYAYVAGGADGLQTYCLLDPKKPTHLHTTAFGCFVNEIAQSGDVVFLGGDSYCGVQICDISNPQAPVQVGHWNSLAPIEDLAVKGTCLYFVDTVNYDWYTGFVLNALDVTDPANPVFVGVVDTLAVWRSDGRAKVVVFDDRLYFAVEDSTHIYDITVPFAPALLGGISEGGNFGVEVVDSVAYLARYTTMYMYDVSLPASPSLLGWYRMQESVVESMELQGDLAYLGSQDNTIEIVDVSDPANPVWQETAYLPGSPVNLTMAYDLIYVANGLAGLYVVSPSGLGGCPTATDLVLPASPYEMVLAGDYAHIVTQTQLLTCDISNPAAPVMVNMTGVIGLGRGLARAGSELYVAAQTGGLRVATGAGTNAPTWIGALAFPYAMQVAVQDEICWVLDTVKGLCAVDISDPTQPVEISALAFSNFPQHVAVSGDRACVAIYNSLPQVIDISNPAVPVLLGPLPGSNNISDIKMRNGLAYLAVRPTGIVIYDVQGDGLYSQRGSVNLPELDSVISLEVSASKAYLGDNYHNLYILEVANPSAPYVIERMELTGTPSSIVVGPDLVYMTTTSNRLSILPAQCDVSLLPTPALGAIAQSGQRLFFWDMPDDDIYVETCVYRGTTPGFTLGDPLLCTTGSIFFDSYQGRGYYVVRHRDTTGRFTLASNEIEFAAASEVQDMPGVPAGHSLVVAPNPFNPATVITFTAARAVALNLEVFDISGRRVGQLFRGDIAAGTWQFTWRGTDSGGRVLPSGAYFVRAQAGGQALTCRVTLLK